MKVKQHFIRLFLLFIILVVFSFHACKDEEEIVPYVRVNFTVPLNTMTDLTFVNSTEYFPYEGYAGVVVICLSYSSIDPSESIYYAYDAACTVEVSDSCFVEANASGAAACNCCGSEYYLHSAGTPKSGVAVKPLKMYNASVDVNNILHVYN
ncbi:MAG TPA: hypothetical protein VJ909_05105 [Prolixibacteraceae bacterium]|nr:hypothetical protein [Prolixibacteraceae bacterium]